jgi:voltage-gated potassium channel
MQLVTPRRLEHMNRAVLSGRIIPYLAGVLGAITVLAALTVRLFAHGEFTSFPESMWWAAQTVTTVGYGDIIPQTWFSKIIAMIVMLMGVATASITTAVITSAVISAAGRNQAQAAPDPQLADTMNEVHQRLDALERIEQRLTALERRLTDE